MDKLKLIEKTYVKKDIPEFKVGDTLKVYVKLVEEEKTRVQAFEGVVISTKASGIKKTFAIRKISYGEGVERTFFVNSPFLEKIEVVKKGSVKRAKLYYLRGKIGKATKIEEEEGALSQTGNEQATTPSENAQDRIIAKE